MSITWRTRSSWNRRRCLRRRAIRRHPNDHWIRNVNPRLRTLPVRTGAPITVNVLAAQSTGSSTKDVSVTLGKLASYFPNSGTAPFWITVEQGQVTEIAQQFLP